MPAPATVNIAYNISTKTTYGPYCQERRIKIRDLITLLMQFCTRLTWGTYDLHIACFQEMQDFTISNVPTAVFPIERVDEGRQLLSVHVL